MSKQGRPCVITGNWKMNKTIEEAQEFVKGLVEKLNTKNQVQLAVPYTVIYPLSQETQETPLVIGAQNMNDASEGAFTGEIAATMLLNVGAKFVLLGHSERRLLYHEDDRMIHAKVKRALSENLPFVLCVGETKAEHDEGKTEEVIERQLRIGLEGFSESQLEKNLMIAYEPVWAIGSGESATPEMAQHVHKFCRQVLSNLFSEKFATKIVIQYGGSVNPKNSNKLLAQEDIDGLLVGGSSLSLESFLQIVNDSNSKI